MSCCGHGCLLSNRNLKTICENSKGKLENYKKVENTCPNHISKRLSIIKIKGGRDKHTTWEDGEITVRPHLTISIKTAGNFKS